MRILLKDLKHGRVKLVPESIDDIWLLSTIIQVDDYVKARTFREIHFGERGSGRSSRIPMTLKIKVSSIEFQPFTTRLRVRGVVVEGPEKYSVRGKYHTISIDIGTEVEIEKPHGWPKNILRRIEMAYNYPPVIIVAIDYDEYTIAIVREQGVKIIESDHLNLPGKADPAQREQILHKAISSLSKKITKYFEEEKPLFILVAGPGLIKDKLVENLRERRTGVKILKDNVSAGGEAGIYEVLRRGIIQEALKEASIIKAEKLVEEFEKRLAVNPEKVAYTIDFVEKAAEIGAVEKVLIVDELLRSIDIEIRRKVHNIMEYSDQTNAEIVIVSGEAPVSHKIRGLGGVIALLRYPVKLSDIR